MPLTNPEKAIRHLYPGIKYNQFRFLDKRGEQSVDSDGNISIVDAIYLSYLDPALGAMPTQAELEAAELAYLPPSFLDGGDREPISAELDANIESARLYYEWRINEFLAEGAEVNEFREVRRVRRPSGMVFERVGKIDNASGYTREDGPFTARAVLVERWRTSVWATAKTLERAWLDSKATETPQPAPTWPELRALLPPWPVP